MTRGGGGGDCDDQVGAAAVVVAVVVENILGNNRTTEQQKECMRETNYKLQKQTYEKKIAVPPNKENGKRFSKRLGSISFPRCLSIPPPKGRKLVVYM